MTKCFIGKRWSFILPEELLEASYKRLGRDWRAVFAREHLLSGSLLVLGMVGVQLDPEQLGENFGT